MLGKAWEYDGADYLAWMSGVSINKCYLKQYTYPICKICLLLILQWVNELMDSAVPEQDNEIVLNSIYSFLGT